MSFFDILQLSLRNLREAKLRATLTTMGVIVGVAVIVTMVSFGLGLQRNTVERFKALDLFNEVTVYGQSLWSLAGAKADNRAGGARQGEPRARPGQTGQNATRILDDAAISEIEEIPGVAYVEPVVIFSAFLRSNGQVQTEAVGGATLPNESSRFKELAAGRMINSMDAEEAVVSEQWALDYGYAKPEEAIGKTIDFLAPPEQREGEKGEEREEPPTFFGLPIEEDETENAQGASLVARSFQIVGVLKSKDPQSGGAQGGGMRGLMFNTRIYIPLKAARAWTLEHNDPMGQVALELARSRGAIDKNQIEGYPSAIVRVTDPVVLTDVRKRLTELGFQSVSIVDQLEQLRTVFLVINSALGLLGGISLVVASFGIANTMIMSILERTREIGIMKAIGAEDREIRLIFFIEAAVIGLLGGVLGALAAWGIDAVANRLAYRFLLKPQGASFIDFFSIPLYLSLGAIAFAVIVSIVAALYPASRAARIDPVKALRHD